METQPEGVTGEPWHLNYFNYFTEVEEQFQRARGTGLFLLSPIDWALIESWKNAGIPLEAVLRGVVAAFEKYRTQKRRGREVNSLAYCSQAVIEEAERMQEGGTVRASAPAEAPFTLAELQTHLARCRQELLAAGIEELAGTAASLADYLEQSEQHYQNLEQLETLLAGLEDKMIAVARARQPDQQAQQARKELESQLRPHRGRMSAPQIAMLERQFLDRDALERLHLPRLSLFYLR
ncbi:MAG: hypothetical protein JJE04_07975 [Acidobacteriia bacterium]|nr:hypothetical protein [Terriglobia bacterium]